VHITAEWISKVILGINVFLVVYIVVLDGMTKVISEMFEGINKKNKGGENNDKLDNR